MKTVRVQFSTNMNNDNSLQYLLSFEDKSETLENNRNCEEIH